MGPQLCSLKNIGTRYARLASASAVTLACTADRRAYETDVAFRMCIVDVTILLRRTTPACLYIGPVVWAIVRNLPGVAECRPRTNTTWRYCVLVDPIYCI